MAKEHTQTESPDPVSPDAPETLDEVSRLREQVAKLEQQNGEFLRHLAEFQTRHSEMQAVLRRSNQEVEQKLKFAHEKFALDLLTALDNLERAIDAARKAGDKGALAQGVLATQMQIADVLRRHGITPIDSMGQAFDPNKHQAIKSQPPEPGQEANTVVMVVQQGFMLHDRVLRPACVIVAQ